MFIPAAQPLVVPRSCVPCNLDRDRRLGAAQHRHALDHQRPARGPVVGELDSPDLRLGHRLALSALR